MKRILSSILGQRQPDRSPSRERDSDDEIPRYPPFAKGLPSAALDRVLATQAELVDRIRHTLALSGDDFDRYVRPVLTNYAAYVHLLPASEAHHHRGAGGLFRHGLEVAFWAAQSAEGVIFAYSSSPRAKREQEPRWRLATCLAGLLHDIGKPASDLSVTSKDGRVIWNPYGETLHSWAVTNNVDRYFLRWRDGRHKRHEQFSVLVVDKIVPHHTLEWLTKTGPEILQAMLEAISGSDDNHVVSSLVLRADNTSVERDLRSHKIVQADGSLGVPVEKYLLDAMRRLINSAAWLINQKGARVWVLNDGPYVVWKQGAEDISRLLAADRVPGIPRDPDTLADILIERNLAVPQQASSGMYRYWTVAPDALAMEDGKRVRLSMLRLVSSDVLFSTEPPSPTGAIVERNGEIQPEPQPVSPPVDQGVDGPVATADVSGRSETVVGSGDAVRSEPDPKAPKSPGKLNPDNPRPAKTRKGRDSGAHPFGIERDADNDRDRLFGSAQEHAAPAKARNVQPKPAEPPGDRREGAPHGRNPASLAPQSVEPSWLDSLPGEGGQALRDIAKKLAEQPQLWGKAIDVAQNRVVIQYPDGAAVFNEPPYILKVLEEAGVLDLDPTMPMRKVRKWGELQGLVLTARASAVMTALRVHEPRGKHPPPAPERQSGKAPPEAIPQQPLREQAPETSGAAPVADTQARKPRSSKNEKPLRATAGDQRIEPSDPVVDVAAAFVQAIRSGKTNISGGVLRSGSSFVLPHTAVGAYARKQKVSPWELRAALARMDCCEFKDMKLFVQE